MVLDVGMIAVVLAVGNVAFYHFEPRMPWSRRVLKVLVILSVTAAISYYFGRTGVLIAMGIAAVPVIYIHGFWLPRHGVNGWTGEPREKYYALRGWEWPPKDV